MVTYTDRGENFASEFGEATIHFMKPKHGEIWQDCRLKAQEILDKLSQEFNPMGIHMVIGAMIELLDEKPLGIRPS